MCNIVGLVNNLSTLGLYIASFTRHFDDIKIHINNYYWLVVIEDSIIVGPKLLLIGLQS